MRPVLTLCIRASLLATPQALQSPRPPPLGAALTLPLRFFEQSAQSPAQTLTSLCQPLHFTADHAFHIGRKGRIRSGAADVHRNAARSSAESFRKARADPRQVGDHFEVKRVAGADGARSGHGPERRNHYIDLVEVRAVGRVAYIRAQ